jgi:hypothetical protein
MNWIKKIFGINNSKPAKKDYDKIMEEKRSEFEWVESINGEKVPAHYLYPFSGNGLTVLVTKYSIYGGIGWMIIDDFGVFEGKLKYRFANISGYTSASGLETGKSETDAIYNRIKDLHYLTRTKKLHGWTKEEFDTIKSARCGSCRFMAQGKHSGYCDVDSTNKNYTHYSWSCHKWEPGIHQSVIDFNSKRKNK